MQVSTGLPLFVALEQKLFEKENLKVETTQFESVNEAMNSLLTGRIDCIQGVGFTTFMAVEQNVTDQFKLIWTCADTKGKFTNGLLKRKGLPYLKIDDLKGKKIGTYTGTSQLINLKVILRNLNIDPDKDVEIIQVGRQIELQAFSSGQFDFLFTIEPDVTIAIEKNIGEYFIPNPRVKYIFDPFVAGGAVVSTKFIDGRKNDLAKLIKIANESIDYIRLHEIEAKSILPKYTPLTNDIAQKSGLYEFWKLGEEDRNAMQALADLYLKEGDLKKPVNTSAMMLPEKY
jgi:NitT/TauT family transport system substrate-binding protein